MAGIVKTELLHLVPKLTELQLLEITDGLKLKLSKPKKERKEALQNLLVRHITSEEVEDSDDEGFALYTTLLAQFKELVAEDEEEKFPERLTTIAKDFSISKPRTDSLPDWVRELNCELNHFSVYCFTIVSDMMNAGL